MLIAFHALGGAEQGAGHLMRCQALAQALYMDDVASHFFIPQAALAICRGRHDWIGCLSPMPVACSESEAADWLITRLQAMNCDALVLDGYGFSAAFRLQLKQSGIPIIVYDDTNSAGPLYADMVINTAAGAKELNYENTAPDARLCLGQDYQLLRSEFYLQAPMTMSERQDLLITLGGSDPAGLTLPLLQALEEATRATAQISPPLRVRVVTGPAYASPETLTRWINSSELAVQHLHHCQQMAEVMTRARLCVSAAGGSQFELHHCLTPSLLLVVADNQLGATRASVCEGWSDMQDVRQGGEPVALAKQALALWQDQAKLESMHQAARISHHASPHMLLDALYKVISDAR